MDLMLGTTAATSGFMCGIWTAGFDHKESANAAFLATLLPILDDDGITNLDTVLNGGITNELIPNIFGTLPLMREATAPLIGVND